MVPIVAPNVPATPSYICLTWSPNTIEHLQESKILLVAAHRWPVATHFAPIEAYYMPIENCNSPLSLHV